MTKLEKLYSIIENSREVGVKLSKDVLQQVEELENTRDWYLFHLCGFTIPLNLFQMLRKIEKYLELSIIIPIFAA